VVSRYRLLSYENSAVQDEQFREDTVDAGEVGAGHSVTALYEVKFHDAAAGPAAMVHIRYQDPNTGQVIEQSAALPARRCGGRVCRDPAQQQLGAGQQPCGRAPARPAS
jgi:Ca-activated chloride channel family protein